MEKLSVGRSDCVIIYYAGVDSNPKDIADAYASGARHFMLSFYYAKKHTTSIKLLRQLGAHIMLDSGAFSAWKTGGVLDIYEYVAYIKRSHIGKYVVLDVVGDPEATAANQVIMENDGLYPIPVFHINSDMSILDELAAKYRYIALGGTVGKSRTEREIFFDEVFERCPDTLFHGLGMTMTDLMRKYPWASVDSTTWLTGKKNARLVTDRGQIPISRDLSVSERVRANVSYFNRLEYSIKHERFGDVS
jgi:hypothetical protein